MAAIELAPGGSVGEGRRYRLQRMVGTGGMASVWLATDTRLDRRVAIKVLSDALALDDDYVLRFEREARVAAKLSHPHLVKIFDLSIEADRPYLVLEYIEGGSLHDLLRHGGQLPRDAEGLTHELLDALGYMHRAGIIHRDIKPANVLIDAEGRARLSDFGIAQPVDAARLTSTGMVMGSARYIAPEVMRGHPASQRSDLYSLGVLIDQCLPAGANARLQTLVHRLTAGQPENRPASAAEALSILDGSRTAPTRLLTAAATKPARIAGWRRGLAIRLRRSRPALIYLLTAAALVTIIIAIIASAGGSGTPTATRLRSLPSSMPLAQQLDQLDRAISRSRR